MTPSPFTQVMVGFLAPFRGTVAIMSSVKLFLLASLPLMIAAVVMFVGVAWAYYNLGELVHGFIEKLIVVSGVIISIVAQLAVLLAWIGFAGAALVIGYVMTSVLAGPFLSLIAEETFKRASPGRKREGSWAIVGKMFLLSLVKASLFLLLALANFVLGFFPPLNIVGLFVILLVIAFDCMDYSMEVDFLTLAQRFRFFFTNFWYFSGLALAILVTNLLPGAFFFLLPGFVAGAAKLYLDLAPQQ